MLEHDEREAVCGDFAESGETGWRALRNLLGLIVRRQAALWKGWQPWLTIVGLVGPLGMLLSLNIGYGKRHSDLDVLEQLDVGLPDERRCPG
jgi:hypothetical protein